MQTVTCFFAGSLRSVMLPFKRDLEEQLHVKLHYEWGPAGLLARRLATRERADVFLSANRAYAEELRAQLDLPWEVRPWIRNRLVLYVKASLAKDNAIETLLNPHLTVGMSTPGSDPSGDYAQGLLSRIIAHYADGAQGLQARTRALVGGANSPIIPAGMSAARYVIDGNLADAFLGYGHQREIVLKAPGQALCALELPKEWVDPVIYSTLLLSAAGTPLLEELHRTERLRQLESLGFLPL